MHVPEPLLHNTHFDYILPTYLLIEIRRAHLLALCCTRARSRFLLSRGILASLISPAFQLCMMHMCTCARIIKRCGVIWIMSLLSILDFGNTILVHWSSIHYLTSATALLRISIY